MAKSKFHSSNPPGYTPRYLRSRSQNRRMEAADLEDKIKYGGFKSAPSTAQLNVVSESMTKPAPGGVKISDSFKNKLYTAGMDLAAIEQLALAMENATSERNTDAWNAASEMESLFDERGIDGVKNNTMRMLMSLNKWTGPVAKATKSALGAWALLRHVHIPSSHLLKPRIEDEKLKPFRVRLTYADSRTYENTAYTHSKERAFALCEIDARLSRYDGKLLRADLLENLHTVRPGSRFKLNKGDRFLAQAKHNASNLLFCKISKRVIKTLYADVLHSNAQVPGTKIVFDQNTGRSSVGKHQGDMVYHDEYRIIAVVPKVLIGVSNMNDDAEVQNIAFKLLFKC